MRSNRSILIEQKLMESDKNWKIQMWHFGWFSNNVLKVQFWQNFIFIYFWIFTPKSFFFWKFYPKNNWILVPKFLIFKHNWIKNWKSENWKKSITYLNCIFFAQKFKYLRFFVTKWILEPKFFYDPIVSVKALSNTLGQKSYFCLFALKIQFLIFTTINYEIKLQIGNRKKFDFLRLDKNWFFAIVWVKPKLLTLFNYFLSTFMTLLLTVHFRNL